VNPVKGRYSLDSAICDTRYMSRMCVFRAHGWPKTGHTQAGLNAAVRVRVPPPALSFIRLPILINRGLAGESGLHTPWAELELMTHS
jgi:hypothetical protein